VTGNSIAVGALALTAALTGGCATTGTATVAVGGYGYGPDGEYSGQGILYMTVATPAYRQLPPESTDGYVSVRSVGGGRVMVVIRFHTRGNACNLQGALVSGGFYLDPGQYCRGFITYRDFDIDAVLRITDGRGVLSGSSLAMTVLGDVDAEHRDGSHNTGTARWQMTASR
jgi:hypothetical protein